MEKTCRIYYLHPVSQSKKLIPTAYTKYYSFRVVQKIQWKNNHAFFGTTCLQSTFIVGDQIKNFWYEPLECMHQKAFLVQSTSELYLKTKEKYPKGTAVGNLSQWVLSIYSCCCSCLETFFSHLVTATHPSPTCSSITYSVVFPDSQQRQ